MTEPSFVVHASRRSSGLPNRRYEYRIWPRQTHPAVSYLQRTWRLVAAEHRNDIYLIPTTRNPALVKLRNGQQLEIKRRIRDVGTIQLWTMPVSTGFPLANAHRAQLAQALALSGGFNVEAGQSPAHLLAALPARAPALVSQMVRKSRLIFRRGNCRAEICRVAVDSWTGLSIALESTDLSSVAIAMDDLQFGQLRNRSYGEVLGLLCGLHPAGSRLPIQFQPHERR